MLGTTPPQAAESGRPERLLGAVTVEQRCLELLVKRPFPGRFVLAQPSRSFITLPTALSLTFDFAFASCTPQESVWKRYRTLCRPVRQRHPANAPIFNARQHRERDANGPELHADARNRDRRRRRTIMQDLDRNTWQSRGSRAGAGGSSRSYQRASWQPRPLQRYLSASARHRPGAGAYLVACSLFRTRSGNLEIPIWMPRAAPSSTCVVAPF